MQSRRWDSNWKRFGVGLHRVLYEESIGAERCMIRAMNMNEVSA